MSDAPSFEPLNDLERLLVRAATEPDQRPAFGRAILESQLCAVSADPGPEGLHVAGDDTRVSLVTIPLEDGRAAIAVFTAPERVSQIYGPGAHYIGMNGRDLIGMISDRPMLLNAGLPYGVLWNPEDLAALLGRPVERTVEKDTRLMLGTPAQRPDDLIMRLTEQFYPVEGVKAAWLALAHWPETDEMAWYFDVRSTLPVEALRDLLGRAVHGADMAGRMLDMTVGPPGGEPGTGIPIVEPR